MNKVLEEITPMNVDDFFIILHHPNGDFDFPLHYHNEYEINIISHFEGSRVVGDSIEEVYGSDLVMIGPSIPHSWQSTPDFRTRVTTIQFSNSLFDGSFLRKNLFRDIATMLNLAQKGIKFSDKTYTEVAARIDNLMINKGFETAIDFLSILNILAKDTEARQLAGLNYSINSNEYQSRRIQLICNYIAKNYNKKITVSEVSALINMTKTGFCHFFKKRTQKSFVDYLNDLRISEAARMLIETTDTISEISYSCGFNNISNFNRIFKRKKNITPKEFRANSKATITIY